MSSHFPRDEALEKEDMIDKIKKIIKKQPTCPAPAASTAGPCPTICQSSRTPWHWKLPSTIARPNHPCNLISWKNYFGLHRCTDWSGVVGFDMPQLNSSHKYRTPIVNRLKHESLTEIRNAVIIYWLTKETLQAFFANGSNRNVEMGYLLYLNKWIIATKLFASSYCGLQVTLYAMTSFA